MNYKNDKYVKIPYKCFNDTHILMEIKLYNWTLNLFKRSETKACTINLDNHHRLLVIDFKGNLVAYI